MNQGPIAKTLRVVAVLALVLWAVSGIYVVKADEAGVVWCLGRVLPIPVKSGIHYHWPYPIAKVTKPKVTQIKSLAIGFDPTEPAKPLLTPLSNEQAEFLTGDENIIHCKLIVQWSICDPIAYSLRAVEPEKLLRVQVESALMAELGVARIDEALTDQKAAILLSLKRRIAQQLEVLEAGVGVIAIDLKELAPPSTANVAHAFKDVASAREDAARMTHEAEGYRNEAFPKARGQAQQRITEARAYHERVANQAKGDAERFSLLYTAYRENPSVTRRRLYLETVDRVMPRMKKYLLGTKAGERATTITVFMDEIKKP